jgi:hypothetical protein
VLLLGDSGRGSSSGCRSEGEWRKRDEEDEEDCEEEGEGSLSILSEYTCERQGQGLHSE